MRARRQITIATFALALAFLLLVGAARAHAAPAAAGRQAGRPAQAAKHTSEHQPGACELGGPVIGGVINKLTNGVCGAAEVAAGVAGGLAGEAAGAAGSELLNTLARWVIGAATQITTFVAAAMRETTTPQLQAGWYEAQFAPMADLGAALGLLVALVALGSAAVRRSPQALAGVLAGIARAGVGTGVVLALTTIGLGVSDQISSAVLAGSPHAFWQTVTHAWGTSRFGGFESSALAMLIALIELFAAVFVWLELIVRGAAIYVAVLFFPVVLAASIWPALSGATGQRGARRPRYPRHERCRCVAGRRVARFHEWTHAGGPAASGITGCRWSSVGRFLPSARRRHRRPGRSSRGHRRAPRRRPPMRLPDRERRPSRLPHRGGAPSPTRPPSPPPPGGRHAKAHKKGRRKGEG